MAATPGPTLWLGGRRHDLRHRALLLAAPGGAIERADAAARTAPLGVEPAGAEVPIVVEVADAAEAARALEAGAAAVHDRTGAAGPELLRVVAAAGATAIVGVPAATDAEAAGLGRDRLVLDLGLDDLPTDGDVRARLHEAARLHAEGHVVLASFAPGSSWVDPAVAGAGYALAVSLGCRVLRAHDVRTARRVAAVVGAIGAAA